MPTVLVTVHGPQRTVDLGIPGDTPIGDLLPLLLDICAPQLAGNTIGKSVPWGLGPVNGAPFPRNQSLIDCDVMDGALLLFQDTRAWESSVATPTATSIPAGADTGGIGIRWNKDGLTS